MFFLFLQWRPLYEFTFNSFSSSYNVLGDTTPLLLFLLLSVIQSLNSLYAVDTEGHSEGWHWVSIESQACCLNVPRMVWSVSCVSELNRKISQFLSIQNEHGGNKSSVYRVEVSPSSSLTWTGNRLCLTSIMRLTPPAVWLSKPFLLSGPVLSKRFCPFHFSCCFASFVGLWGVITLYWWSISVSFSTPLPLQPTDGGGYPHTQILVPLQVSAWTFSSALSPNACSWGTCCVPVGEWLVDGPDLVYVMWSSQVELSMCWNPFALSWMCFSHASRHWRDVYLLFPREVVSVGVVFVGVVVWLKGSGDNIVYVGRHRRRTALF